MEAEGVMATVTARTRGAGQLDHEQVAELYAAHRLGLVRLAVLLVDDRESAEDVVQDAFAGLVKNGRLRDPAAALGYLRTAVVNNARSALRRRRTVRAHTPRVEVPRLGPEGVAELREEHREVVLALQRLAPRQREVLVLRYWCDLPEAEIAQTMGVSAGTVKSTASRALDALETMMEATR